MLKDIMQPFIMHLNGRSYSIMHILLNRVQKIYFMDGGKNFCCPCMLMKCTTECFGSACIIDGSRECHTEFSTNTYIH